MEDDEEEDEGEGGIQGDTIYPELVIDPKTNNPETNKRWTKKEINEAYRKHVEGRWSEDVPPAPHVPFPFTGHSPGPACLETTALAVLERFITTELLDHIVEASNEYAISSRYKKRRQREGVYSKPID